MDWHSADENLFLFTRAVAELRYAHPVFRRRRHFSGRPVRYGDPLPDIAWLTPSGTAMSERDWNSGFARCIMVFLNGEAILEPDPRGERIVDDSFLLCFNAYHSPIELTAPPDFGDEWTIILDTETGQAGESGGVLVPEGGQITIAGHALLLLRRTVRRA